MSATFPVYVAGASGLLAGEFLRLLLDHSGLHLEGAYTREGGQDLRSLHPHLPMLEGEVMTVPFERLAMDLQEALSVENSHAVLLLGLPHGQCAPWWAANRDRFAGLEDRLTVIDLSADFRLQDGAAYRETYGAAHACPEELGGWAYGLPELHALPEGTRKVAVPGCFATAMQLAVMPAVHGGFLDLSRPLILQGVTGSSGSGAHASAGTHHPHRHGNFKAYGLGGHRHEAELLAPRNFESAPVVDFTPHSGPFSRGIHLHAVLPMGEAVDASELKVAYAQAYENQPFVQVQDETPELRQIVGSNRALIGISTRGSNLHAICVLDNTLKGGAGQAMQCLNRVLGLPESTSLSRSGLGY
ncbi:MAG: N-acetyl-gamma-glutamyl-phosphate reductase [Planctomycetes bacterium]|nr:N-acetyl-gamma-glutamyl-phosphate reductase [Planctomycetota bacterium]